MKRDRNFRVFIIIALCLAIVALSVGYANLNRQLTINATATKKAATWSVKFQNISEPVITGSAEVKTAASLTDTNITIDVYLTKPGDSISYTFDVTNDGTIDAKLSDIPTITGIDAASTKDVTVTFTHSDDSAFVKDEALDAEDTQSLKLVATYNASATTVEESEVPLPITATLLYVQK